MSGLLRSFDSDFNALAAKHGERTALIIPAEVDPVGISYSELQDKIQRCITFYRSRGLKPGDVIFSLMPNSAETIVCFLAAISGGYGFAPLPCVASKREIERWTGLVKPRLCLTTGLVGEDETAAIRRTGTPLELIVADSSFTWLPGERAKEGSAPGARVYLSTSGTTGEPKAMVIDANRLWSSGQAFMKFHGLSGAQLTFWNYLPMSYLGGLFNLTLIPLSTGGSIVIDETFSGKTVLQFWQTVARFGVDALWLVPAIVRGLTSMAERTAPASGAASGRGIRAAFIGTAPIDLAAKRKFENIFGFPVLENFALSETTFFSSETAANGELRGEGSVGEILPYADVKFVKTSADAGAPSEILVRSPFLFLGYLQPDGNLSLPLDPEGYLPTGDLGELNKDNILVITGRIKDFIKKGGYLVPLREVEVLAEQHPSVRQAAAVRTAHAFYGESFDLYLTLSPEAAKTSLDEIGRYLHQNLIKYKWPEKIVAVEEFPRTPSGKIQKHLLAGARKID